MGLISFFKAPSREDLLRYECYACGAQPGCPCRTMRHHPGVPHKVGYVTQPHKSRYVQYWRDQEKGSEVMMKQIQSPDSQAVERVLREADGSLVDDLSTPEEVAARLLEAGCLGWPANVAGWSRNCPLAVWFQRFLLQRGMMSADQYVSYDGAGISVRENDVMWPLLGRHSVSGLLRRFAAQYDRYEFPDLVVPEFRRLEPK